MPQSGREFKFSNTVTQDIGQHSTVQFSHLNKVNIEKYHNHSMPSAMKIISQLCVAVRGWALSLVYAVYKVLMGFWQLECSGAKQET